MSGADLRRIALVGNGLAAVSAAERLREQGYSGELMMIGTEHRPPYNRTPLSKQLLTGQLQPDGLRVRTYTDLAADWKLGVTADSLDTEARCLHLSDGTELGFDGLVIATGVQARTLPTAPMHTPHVTTLRTLDDARLLDEAMAHSIRRVAVVGGGFIGCEIAATARSRALPVTIIDLSPTLLGHSLGHILGAAIGEIHRHAGVRLHLGTAVHTWDPHGDGVRLHLDDGEVIDADVVVVGVGTTTATGWLDGSGIETSDGVSCAPDCTVLDTEGQPVAGIVAAGDVARWANLRFDPVSRRVEHWINAIEMGRHAADTLLSPQQAQPFTPMPRFWSEQHGTRIQAAGLPALGDHVTVVEGNTRSRSLVAAYTREDQLVGVVTLNAPRRLQHYTQLIGGPITTSVSQARHNSRRISTSKTAATGAGA